MKIVITGSLGHIGKPLTSALVRDGHAVTVISNNSDKKAAIEALGATSAIGTLQDLDFLTRVFEGTDAVYLMIPPNYSGVTDVRTYYRQIGENYAEAIRRTGVGRVVFLSSMGADLDKGTGVVLGVHDGEGILDGLSGVRLTHLRPGYFYYNLFNYVGQIKGLGFISDNFGGEDRLEMVAPFDIAVVAAEELTVTGAVQHIRYISSDSHTVDEVVRLLGPAIGIPDLKWTIVSDAERLDAMTKFGMPPAFAASLVEMNASIHNGSFYSHYASQKLSPTGKTKLEDFLKEYAAAFKQGTTAQHG